MVETQENPLKFHDDGIDAPSKDVGTEGFIFTMKLSETSTGRSGKWCVVRDAANVDALWAQIRKAVLAGEIMGALVSTPHQAASHGDTYVICVFNTDCTDLARVNEVREFLRGLGVTEEIGYKRDIDTFNGVYGTPAEWMIRA